MMATTSRTVIFRPRHPEFIIFLETECTGPVIPKARPAGATVIFPFAVENSEVTSRAMENTYAFFIIER